MRFLFDINHPGHVHFFHEPARILQKLGHEVLFTSRDKDVTLDLMARLDIPNRVLSGIGNKGILSLVKELVQRDLALYRVVREFRPDVMASVGGTFIAHVSAVTRIPALVFYDTENARLQNAITYPFASCVIVPNCYHADVPAGKHIRYKGYHELSYLSPNRFSPSRDIAIQNGLAGDRPNFFIRLVSWQANHDIGEAGWTPELLDKVVSKLAPSGKIHISSEAQLPERFVPHLYSGSVENVHHVMGHCRLFVGESATMASESVVMGVPAVYAALTGRGYTDEQESKYRLVTNVRRLEWPDIERAIDGILATPREEIQQRAERMWADTIDVAEFVAATLQDYREALDTYHQNTTAN